ncbi:putative zinc-binding protein [Bacteroidota bacterium]
METKSCSCKENTAKTVFACSGAADLGEVSDLVARKMHRDGVRQMKCLAFIGGGIQDMIDSVKDTNMLVIDGCNLDCGKLTMEKNGISDYCHLRLTDLGHVKGQTPVTIDVVTKITEHAIGIS